MADSIKKYVSLSKLDLYDEKIKKYLADADTAKLAEAKQYVDDTAATLEPKGSAATALAEAKTYADSAANAKDAAIQAAQAQADKGVTDAATAQAAAEAAQGAVDTLDAFVGDLPEGRTEASIVEYINKKAEETLNAATGDGGESAASVKLQLDNYKTSNDAAVAANKTAAENAQKSADDAMAAVEAEAARADAAEKVNAAAIKAISDDYLKAADKEALQTQITTNANAIQVLTEGVDAEKVDGVKDLIAYVEEHGTEVTGMKGDISANAAAITAEAERAAGVEAGLQTAVEKAQSDANTANTGLAAEIERATGVEEDFETRIAGLEGKFGDGEGSVEDLIAEAQTAAQGYADSVAATKASEAQTAAKNYTDGEIDTVEASIAALTETVNTKAAQADLTALTSRVAANETAIDGHTSRLSAVEALAAANKTAHEANATAISKLASQESLNAVSARVTTLETWHDNFQECSEQDISDMFA